MKTEIDKTKIIGWLLLPMAFMTFVFLFNTISASTMNYNSEKIHALLYFTNQTNILMLFWMIFLSLYTLSGEKMMRFSVNPNLTAALTTYILITGIIYWLVLVPTFYKPGGDNSWLFSPFSIWTHSIVPVTGVILLFLVKATPDKAPANKKSLYFFIYPLLYLCLGIYLSTKGKYLYPMFNPELLGGWVFVALSLAAILVIFTGIYFVLLKIVDKTKVGPA